MRNKIKFPKKEKPPEVYITGGQPVDMNGVAKNTEAAPTPTNDENEKLRNEFFTIIDIIRSSDDLMKKDGGSDAK